MGLENVATSALTGAYYWTNQKWPGEVKKNGTNISIVILSLGSVKKHGRVYTLTQTRSAFIFIQHHLPAIHTVHKIFMQRIPKWVKSYLRHLTEENGKIILLKIFKRYIKNQHNQMRKQLCFYSGHAFFFKIILANI